MQHDTNILSRRPRGEEVARRQRQPLAIITHVLVVDERIVDLLVDGEPAAGLGVERGKSRGDGRGREGAHPLLELVHEIVQDDIPPLSDALAMC
jgi:hypothetical protein